MEAIVAVFDVAGAALDAEFFRRNAQHLGLRQFAGGDDGHVMGDGFCVWRDLRQHGLRGQSVHQYAPASAGAAFSGAVSPASSLLTVCSTIFIAPLLISTA